MKDLNTLFSKLAKTSDEQRFKIYDTIFSTDADDLIKAFESNTDWVLPFLSDCLQVGDLNIDRYVFHPFSEFVKNHDLKLTKEVREIIVKKLDRFLKEVSKAFDENADEKQAVRSLTVYGIVVKLLTETILASREIVNKLCEVPKLGFKSKNEKINEQAFVIWRIWVDVFAKDPNWSSPEDLNDLHAQQRLSLILKPLMYLKLPMFTFIFDTWWHTCRSLRHKLPLLFDDVVFGLIKYCVGGKPTFLAEGSKPEDIIEAVTTQFDKKTQPVFVLNETLRKLTYVLMELPQQTKSQVVLDTFFDLLKCLLTKEERLSKDVNGVPPKIPPLGDVYVFSNPTNVINHSVFLGQCIRWYSRHASADDIRIHDLGQLWVKLAAAVNSLHDADQRRTYFQFFMAQLQEWVIETQHSFTLVYEALKTLIDEKIFSYTNLPEDYNLCTLTETMYKKALGREKVLDTDCLQTLILAILNNLKHGSEPIVLQRVSKFVAFVDQLLKDANIEDEVFMIVWTKLSGLMTTVLKAMSISKIDFLEDDYKTCLYILSLPARIIKKSDQIDLNIRNLKPLFLEVQKSASTIEGNDMSSTGIDLLATFRKIDIIESCKKDSNLLSLASEYLLFVFESFPWSDVLKEAKIAEPVFGVSAIKALPEKMRPLLAGLTSFALTVYEASTTANTDRQITQLLMSLNRITNVALNTVRTMNVVFQNFTNDEESNLPNIVLSLIELLVNPLANILEMSNEKNFNGLVKNHTSDIHALLQNLKVALKSSYPGPYDDELLKKMDRLFVVGFVHAAPRVRNPIIELWKSTFEKATTLELSEELKKIVLEHAKRLGIFVPSLNVGVEKFNLDEDMASDSVPAPKLISSPWRSSKLPTQKTPIYKQKQPPTFGSAGKIFEMKTPEHKKPTSSLGTKSEPRKRPATVLFSEDDESQDFVFVQTPPSKRKQRLTEHQKEKLMEKKDTVLFIDEESTQTLTKKLPDDFVLESTQSESSNSNIFKTKPQEIEKSESSSTSVVPETASSEAEKDKDDEEMFTQDSQLPPPPPKAGSILNFLTPRVDSLSSSSSQNSSKKVEKEEKKDTTPKRRSLRKKTSVIKDSLQVVELSTKETKQIQEEAKPTSEGSQQRGRPRKSVTKLFFEEEKSLSSTQDDEKLSSLNEMEEMCTKKIFSDDLKSSTDSEETPKAEDLFKNHEVLAMDTCEASPKMPEIRSSNTEKSSSEVVSDTVEPMEEQSSNKDVQVLMNSDEQKCSEKSSEASVVPETSLSDTLESNEMHSTTTSHEVDPNLAEKPTSEVLTEVKTSSSIILDAKPSSQIPSETKSDISPAKTFEPKHTPIRGDSAPSSSDSTRTPTGILKKFDSPSTAEKKLRRVHFLTSVNKNLETVQESSASAENSPSKSAKLPARSSIRLSGK